MDPTHSISPLSAPKGAGLRCGLFLLHQKRLQRLGVPDVRGGPDGLEALDGSALDKLPMPIRALLEKTLATKEEAVLAALKLNEHLWWTRSVALPSIEPPAVILCMVETAGSLEFDRSLRQLERLAGIGTLAAGYAHEIRNSLVAAKTFVDLLLEKNKDAELADVVGREMRRTDALIGQMLRFAGPARTSRAPIQLRQVVQHSLQLVQHQVDGKSITVERLFAAEDDTVAASEYELQQAMVNLLLNALDATAQHGRIKIATAPANVTPRQVQLAISDSGVGIAPEHLSRMFEPFFTTKHGGTGLGLAITRRIVEEHHGRISVESTPGNGATFTIMLPLARSEAALNSATQPL